MANAPWNYLADLAARIKAEHEAALTATRSTVKHARAAGQLLIEAKAQLEHGQWLPWLEQTGVSARTAQKYMRLARLYSDKNAAASHLTIDGALDSVAEHCEPLMIARLREAHVAYDGVLAALDHLEGIATNHDAERAVERLIEACNVAVKARCEAKVCFEAWVDDSCADEDPPTLRGRKRQLDLLDEATRLLDGLAQKMRSCVPDKLEALKVRLEGCVSEFGYQRD